MLNRYLADWKRRSLSSITRPMVQRRYRELCARSVSQANLAMRYLRAVFGFTIQKVRDADQRPLRIDNPLGVLRHQWIKLPWRTRVMSTEQMRRWLHAVRDLVRPGGHLSTDGRPARAAFRDAEAYRDLFLFLALTGCRMSEALRLKCRDVDWLEGRMTFRRTKNRRDHILPLTVTLREILARRIAACRSDLVFSSRRGKPFKAYRRVLERIREVAGVHFTPHDLRRWAATAMEQAGVGAYTIKGVLNHLSGLRVTLGTLKGVSGETQVVMGEIQDADRDMTGRYVQVTLDMKRWALEKLEPYLLGEARFEVTELGLPLMPRRSDAVKRMYVRRRRGEEGEVVEIVGLDSETAYTAPTPEKSDVANPQQTDVSA